MQLPSDWWDEFGVTGAGSSSVSAMVPYNGGLVVGGAFFSVGNTRAENVAFWDGTHWQPMGEGLPDGVLELAIYNGRVVAASGDAVQEWDGNQWNVLGGGTDDLIYALTVYDGNLIAGGFFTMAGAESVGYIAQWDGNSWQPVGEGFDDWVIDLSVYDDKLAAMGYFGAEQCCSMNAAEWNGSTWSSVPVSGEISFLQGSGDSLFIGGEFSLNGANAELQLAVWNGDTLHAMGPALDFTPYALKFIGDQIFLSGSYRVDPFLFNYRLTKWDGNNWIPQITDARGWIGNLEELQGNLVIGGDFETVEGELMNGISRKEGDTWLSFGPGDGMNGFVVALEEAGGSLVAGGQFTFAGSVRANRVAQWDGQVWQPFGSGMSWEVFSLATFSNKLIAGGLFTQASGMAALHVAEWDGTVWSQMGAGFDNSVWALEVFNDSLYAGGTFTKSGDVDLTGIARWDGQNWVALPPLANPLYAAHPSVGALLNRDTSSELVVGGDFREAMGLTVNHVARWNGASWSAMGDGLNGVVEDLCEFQGAVVACGGFTMSGTTTVNRIARWNGTSWQPIGSGFPSGRLSAVEVHQGVLVAGGFLTKPDDRWQAYAAFWDGQNWQTLGEIEGSEVRAMRSLGNSLFLGGSFVSVNGVPSYSIARLDGLDFVPVKSVHFEIARIEGSAVLKWDATGSLEGLAAFRLDRRIPGSAPVDLGIIENEGGSHFEYVDQAAPSGEAEYRLWGIDRSGASTFLGSTVLRPATGATPRIALFQSSPNPCRGAAVISFQLREETKGTLKVLDSMGREVVRLWSGSIPAGETTIHWNGQDRLGHSVPSGIYYYQLNTPFERVSRRLVVVR